MELKFAMRAWMFACAIIETIYGALLVLVKRSAPYLQMIACGMGEAVGTRRGTQSRPS